MKRVAIIEDDSYGHHSASWAASWIEYCDDKGLEYDLIAWRKPDALDRMLACDALLWHFSHYSRAEMAFARSFLYATEMAGIPVFPGYPDAWHFDDKIAQSLFLKAIKAPIPAAHCFYDMETLSEWVGTRQALPVVAKLKAGSGSQSVKLLHNREEVLKYGRTMLKGRGQSSTPSTIFKATSNLRSAASLSEILARAKRVPEFLHSLRMAKQMPMEQGYVYLQDFIPNDGFDLKVVVVGDKLSFIGRSVRKNDFRASGGGALFYDRDLMSPGIIDCAFEVSDKMGSLCAGFDFAINSETGEPVILEVSYGFSNAALLKAGGYYDRAHQWTEEPMNAPHEILKALLKS